MSPREAPHGRSGARARVVALLLLAAGGAAAQAPPAADPWTRADEIVARIQLPRIPARDFDITRFGARGDGLRDASPAIARALQACARAGGGRIVVPPGDFLSGPIRLPSRTELHVAKGATLRFSRDPARYPLVLTRFEGVELMNYSPLVYAFEAEDVSVTGEGTLDGQADEAHWWPWKRGGNGAPDQRPDRDRLFRQAQDGVPVAERVYGPGHYLRPAFIQAYRCRNVLIQGVTVRAAPFWVIHPVLSKSVTVRRVKIASLGPNNDGCDPESSEDVLIEDSDFDTGDDCIALKSGRNADGRRLATPVRNVVVRRCRMRAGHGGVTIGSEISGGASGVFVERCAMSSPDLERGLRIKTNAMRGGVIEDVFVRDVEIGEVQRGAVDVSMLYEEGAQGPFTPVIRNLVVERLSVARAGWALFVEALATSPLRGLRVKDSVFRGVRHGSRLDGVLDVSLEGVTIEPER